MHFLRARGFDCSSAVELGHSLLGDPPGPWVDRAESVSAPGAEAAGGSTHAFQGAIHAALTGADVVEAAERRSLVEGRLKQNVRAVSSYGDPDAELAAAATDAPAPGYTNSQSQWAGVQRRTGRVAVAASCRPEGAVVGSSGVHPVEPHEFVVATTGHQRPWAAWEHRVGLVASGRHLDE